MTPTPRSEVRDTPKFFKRFKDSVDAGVHIDDSAAAIGCNNLEPVDPSIGLADEIDRNNVAGGFGADNVQYIGKALDFAVLDDKLICARNRCDHLAFSNHGFLVVGFSSWVMTFMSAFWRCRGTHSRHVRPAIRKGF